jgi:antiphage defense system Thoeris ThsB-like protein
MSKRAFIAFAVEDKTKRDFVVGQSKLDKSQFEFADFSVKEPWDQNWKTNCRTRIRGCDGVIALISKNTPKADGQLWEIQCGYDEDKPVMLMWVNDDRPAVPGLLKNKLINVWSWANLKSFMGRL